MADDIAQIKQLQAGLNAAFESLFATAQKQPDNATAIGGAKSEIAKLAQITAGTCLGPALAIMGLSFQPVAYMAIRVASDLGVFELIDKPTTLDELVLKTSADPVTLMRILRAVSTVGYLKEAARVTWEPTPLTYAMRVPALRDWLKTHFDMRMKTYGAFPEWLAKRQYKSTGGVDDTVTSDLLGMPFWKHFETHPNESAVFDSAMSIQESFPPDMRPPYPFTYQLNEIRTDADAVTLVDIGGGFGQALQQIRIGYPDVKGQFILQDLSKTIELIDPGYAATAGFKPMTYDFFTPQPIKGAKYYHLRRVLHDWNDGSSKQILRHVYEAMKDTADYSRLLIHEFVLPEVGCELTEAMVDLMMMTTVDGTERTESQFHDLLGACGFKILKIWRAKVGTTAVIEAAIA